MKQANKSLLALGYVFFAKFFSDVAIPLVPIYGGLTTTSSYCAANNSACRTSGSKVFNASTTSMPCPFNSLNRLNAGNFSANTSGT